MAFKVLQAFQPEIYMLDLFSLFLMAYQLLLVI